MCERCERRGLGVSRRHVLGAGLGLAALGGLRLRPSFAADAPQASTVSPDQALQRLVEGNARYAANVSTNKDFSAGRAAQAEAQHPFAAILGCADSRVGPELAFDQGPGELFVVRVAGNFVDDDGLASLEYGVQFLGIPLIVVLGHSNCGAVAATIKVIQEKAGLPGHLPELVENIKPAVETAIARKPADLLAEATRQNVLDTMQQLAEAAPIVGPAAAGGRIRIVGGVYDIATGKVAFV